MKHPFLLLLFVIPLSPVIDFGSDRDSKAREKLVDIAMQYLNTSYKSGGDTPRGFDCSGFTKYIYRRALNKKLDHGASLQAQIGKKVKIHKAKKGDLLFFKKNGRINHVGIVTKANKDELWVIHSTTSRGVIAEDVKKSSYWNSKIAFVRSHM
jgi:cell wall-associated NlpC family hydrolase